MAFKRAIVTAVGPLRILIDGDTVPIPFTPKSLIDPATLTVGDVVHANQSGHRLVVLGRAGGLVLSDASTSVKGIVELATDAETITGTDDVRAVTPTALAAALNDSGVREAMGIPFAQAAGIATTSGTSGGSSSVVYWDGTTTITLPVGLFSVTPSIGAGIVGSSGVVWSALTAASSTSFSVRTMRVGAAPATYALHWRAVQMSSGGVS